MAMSKNQFDKAVNQKLRDATIDGEGIVINDMVPWFVAEVVTADDAALCRNTKPLIEAAYGFFRQGIACRVEGRDIGQGLIQLATKWKAVKTLGALMDKLYEYQVAETDKWTAKGNAFKVQSIEDKCDTLRVIIDHLLEQGLTDISDLTKHINSLFGDTPEGERPKVFTLSTIHKAKGREWNRVYILRRDLMPSKYAKQAWELQQEENLEYVAITRAKVELIYVAN